jgi:hypothetical protein
MRAYSVATAAYILFGAAIVTPAGAISVQRDIGVSSSTVLVAEGCGPGRWRGPWGHCRTTPYHGPLPGGGYQ